MKRRQLIFTLLGLALILAFVLDLVCGAVAIPYEEFWQVLTSPEADSPYRYIIYGYRLPKALTALLAGSGMAVAGLQMQNLFRNPLADTSILGINSGAGLGVAIYTMAYSLLPPAWGVGLISSWGIVLSACLGAMLVLLLITCLARRMQDLVAVLIIGVMMGFLASSLIAILQFFSREESLRSYLLWSFGSVSATSWGQLMLMLPIVGLGLGCSLLMPKGMNALSLGASYAQSVGIHVGRLRASLIVLTGLITGCITAFAGPIAFVGLAVPHFVRLLLDTSDHRQLIPACILAGALLLLLCDMISQMPGQHFVLPINAITSLIGAPTLIFILWSHRQKGGFK